MKEEHCHSSDPHYLIPKPILPVWNTERKSIFSRQISKVTEMKPSEFLGFKVWRDEIYKLQNWCKFGERLFPYFRIPGYRVTGKTLFWDCLMVVFLLKRIANVNVVCQIPVCSLKKKKKKRTLTFASLSLMRLVHWELI